MSTMSPPEARRRAEDLLESNGPAVALEVLATTAHRLAGDDLYFGAQLALLAGEPTTALAWLDLAREALRSEGTTLLALRTDLGRINVLADLSRLDEGIEVAGRLERELAEIDPESLSDEDADLHRWLQAAAAENLGATLGLVGQHAHAVQALDQAKALYHLVGSPTDLARVRGNLGIELLETGSPDAALAELRSAHEQFSDDTDEWLVHRCIVAESRSLAMMGEYGDALHRLAESDRFIEDHDWSENPDALRAQLARGDVEIVLNLFPEVLETGNRLQPLFAERAMTRELAESLMHSARALLGIRNSEQAEHQGLRAVKLFEQAGLPIKAAYARAVVAQCRRNRGGEELIDVSLTLLRDSGERYGIATVALCGADLASTADARLRFLKIAEEAGALVHPETAWKALWHKSALATTTTEANELLDQSLGAIQSLRSGLDTDHLRAPFLVDRRDPLESRLANHVAASEIHQAFTLSASFRAATLSTRPAAQPSQAATASPTESTLLYQSIGNRLVCFIKRAGTPDEPIGGCNDDELRMVDLGPALGTVDDLLVDLEAQWSHLADPRLRVHIDRFRSVTDKILQRLHIAVFAPIEQLLPDGPITIVPTGRLAALPFTALHDGTSYLIDRRLISIAPGVPQRIQPTSPARAALIVGVPDHRAPKIREEVEQITLASGGQLLLGDQATVSATQEALAYANTLHLAGHSSFRPENPSMSAFSFADRDITAAELCTWDLEGKTVVLASCSSGRQSNLGEDELQGLPRALLLAGADRVIMNYWDVDDASTATLMAQFHQKAVTCSVADALRAAQIATRELFDHPFFWAAPVHYRNPVPSPQSFVEQHPS